MVVVCVLGRFVVRVESPATESPKTRKSPFSDPDNITGDLEEKTVGPESNLGSQF